MSKNFDREPNVICEYIPWQRLTEDGSPYTMYGSFGGGSQGLLLIPSHARSVELFSVERARHYICGFCVFGTDGTVIVRSNPVDHAYADLGGVRVYLQPMQEEQVISHLYLALSGCPEISSYFIQNGVEGRDVINGYITSTTTGRDAINGYMRANGYSYFDIKVPSVTDPRDFPYTPESPYIIRYHNMFMRYSGTGIFDGLSSYWGNNVEAATYDPNKWWHDQFVYLTEEGNTDRMLQFDYKQPAQRRIWLTIDYVTEPLVVLVLEGFNYTFCRGEWGSGRRLREGPLTDVDCYRPKIWRIRDSRLALPEGETNPPVYYSPVREHVRYVKSTSKTCLRCRRQEARQQSSRMVHYSADSVNSTPRSHRYQSKPAVPVKASPSLEKELE